LLAPLAFGNKYLRLIYTQAVMRAPINLRPLLFVPKEKNPKGIGLFAHAYCNLYDLWQDPADRDRAEYCINWLLKHRSPGDYAGPCWGYNFAWQTPSFFVPRYVPNMVVSTVVGQAFVRAFEVFGQERYLDTARGVIEFIRHNLQTLRDQRGLHYYSYTPLDHSRVINVSALGAGLMSRVYQRTREERLIQEARRAIRFVVDKQTNDGAWYYTDPPEQSPLTHDNYHTGFVLDAILQYIHASGDNQWVPNYQRGIEFYAQQLFLDDGTPKFLYNRMYPIDIHGAAQGIISFSQGARLYPEYQAKAIKIAQWAEENMMGKDGGFYYQRLRYLTKRFSLMRWAQGWMCLALSTLLESLEGIHERSSNL
jgi:rhamnogalacturonyl hydrolase YesR